MNGLSFNEILHCNKRTDKLSKIVSSVTNYDVQTRFSKRVSGTISEYAYNSAKKPKWYSRLYIHVKDMLVRYDGRYLNVFEKLRNTLEQKQILGQKLRFVKVPGTNVTEMSADLRSTGQENSNNILQEDHSFWNYPTNPNLNELMKIFNSPLLRNASKWKRLDFMKYCKSLGDKDPNRLKRLSMLETTLNSPKDSNQTISWFLDHAQKGFVSKNVCKNSGKNWEFKKYDKVENIDLNEVLSGDVCDVNGCLHINDNGKIKPLKLSKDKFEELFPPNLLYQTRQGDIGNCYFVSELNGLLETPNGRAKLFQMIEQDGDDIIVKINAIDSSIFSLFLSLFGIKNHKDDFKTYSIKFPQGEIHKTTRKGLLGAKGFQYIEKAFGKIQLLNKKGGKIVEDYSQSTNVDEIIDSLEGGFPGYFISALFKYHGANDIFYNLAGKNVGKVFYTAKDAEKCFFNYANKENVIMLAMTKPASEYKNLKTLADRAEGCVDKDNSIFSDHGYTIKGYNPKTKTVYYSNPWANAFIHELPLEVFTDFFKDVRYIEV